MLEFTNRSALRPHDGQFPPAKSRERLVNLGAPLLHYLQYLF